MQYNVENVEINIIHKLTCNINNIVLNSKHPRSKCQRILWEHEIRDCQYNTQSTHDTYT